MQQSIRKLIEYLMEHQYDCSISPKILNAPTNKDFVAILSFLLKSVIPNFKFGPKFEEEVPEVLRYLGYPFALRPGHLRSVGSQDAWPQALAALSWIVELLKYSEAAFDESNDDAFDNEDGNKVFFEYLQKGYDMFLSGEDDLSPLDEQLALRFDAKNGTLKSDIASLEAANADLSAKLQELTSGETPLQKAQSLNTDLISDTDKFEKHINQLKDHRQKVSTKLEGEKTEAHERAQELEGVLAKIEEDKATIAKQELTPSDVERMNASRDELEGELSQLKAQKDELTRQLFEEERAVARGIDRLEAKVQQANTSAMQLLLIPAEAKNAGGVSHQIDLNKHLLPSEPWRLLSLDPATVIKPSLTKLRDSFVRDFTSSQEALDEAEEAESKRDEEKQLEREEKLLREQQARQLEEINKESEQLQEGITTGRQVGGQSLVQEQSKLAALRKELSDFERSSSAELERMTGQLVSELDVLTDHKQRIEQQLQELNEYLGGKMQVLHSS